MNILEVLNEIKPSIVYIFDRLREPTENKETEGKYGPVVAVHGLFGAWSKRGLYKYLKENNVRGVLVDFGWQTGRIDKYVEKLAKEINNRNLKSPILMGYSMGGIIVTRYAQKYGWNKIKKAIVLATPFNGAKIAKFIRWLPAGRDLSPNSKLLKALQKTKPPKGKLICVFPKWDQYTKKQGAVLPGCVKVNTSVGGHMTLLNFSDNLKTVFDQYLLEKKKNERNNF